MAYRAEKKLGNYRLERLLGRGGFAEVYLGKHIYLNTQAAIKVLQKQLSDEALEKFLQEARIIASLKHPHIVSVLEFGIEEQRPFLVMAYAPYGTLRRRYSRSKALPPTIIAPHVRQIADALHYAHERKIIHRDVKPENMLLDDNNTVLLSDFGLAMREHSTYRSVHSTDSAGTMIYMAPEQLLGKPCTASDQYALGVVMYEWLCGCLPFDGPDVSVVVQHLHEPPAPLRTHVPTLPLAVEAVVLRALEKDPKQRFPSVQELANAFEDACKELPVLEDLAMIPLVSVSGAGSDAPGGVPQESLSSEFIGLLPSPIWEKASSADEARSAALALAEMKNVQAPSLSASLHVSMSTQDSAAAMPISTVLPSNKKPVSRRTMLVGIGALIGGAAIWRLSSGGISVATQSVQSKQRTIAGVPASSTPTSQAPSTPGTAATKGSSTGKNSGSTGTTPSAPPSLPNGSKPTPGSFPAATPVATDTPGVSPLPALAAQISVPSSIAESSNVPITVKTNLGNIAFDVTAEFYYTDNKGQTQNPKHANIAGNTTDSSGNATIEWPSWHIAPGKLKQTKNPITVFQAIVTDTNGNTIYSQTATAQVVA